MNATYSRLASLGLAALLTVAGAARADDSEIFSGLPNSVASQRPNILFIFDTSGSMSSLVTMTVEPEADTGFDPGRSYSGRCDPDMVYFRDGNRTPWNSSRDGCDTDNAIPAAAFKCAAGWSEMNTGGSYYALYAAQYKSRRRGDQWDNSISSSTSATAYVECSADSGVHGDGVNTTRLWAADENDNGPWSSRSGDEITWRNMDDYTFWTGNYLNWYYGSSSGGSNTITKSRLAIMQEVAEQTITELKASDSVNIGLMRYSTDADGGMVLRAIDTAGTTADNMIQDIQGLNADGYTPLSETMHEAYLYLSGNDVRYGLDSRPVTSISSSRVTGNQSRYLSPIIVSCQKTYIVLLTDGLPTRDRNSDTAIESLVGRRCTDNYSSYTWSGKDAGDGRCLEEIAEYMYDNDLRPDLPDTQNVITYTIGFGEDIGIIGTDLLRDVAAAGGGQFYAAGNTAELSAVLTTIVRSILTYNTSFTAPAVSVNAFNRTQNLNDLFVSVFKPTSTYRWPGNLKKYRLSADGTIRDADGQPAVDVNTGFFRDGARSYWSATSDGDDVRKGGAAKQLPVPADRKVYTNLGGSTDLTAAGNALSVGNAAITSATLGLAAGDPLSRDELVQWLRGADIDDADNDGDTTDARLEMGDPMHGRPATVIYGGTVDSPDPYDGAIFAATNEGFLHAFDVDDGHELWAWMPAQLLARASDLYEDGPVPTHTYGLDGDVRVFKHDVNENGIVEPDLGDRVLVFFGMRRGGSDYFGLDVTDRDSPELLWKIGPDEAGDFLLPEAGQSWSTPTVARVNVGGATQNELKLVLLLGGGYDTRQDNDTYTTDSVGNRIFMVDALSGRLLWYAGSDAAADLTLTDMQHSIPADIRALDVTGDGFADRMYTADMGGRVWRFDVLNGQAPGELVTGGVFASLGNAHLGSHPPESTRRFYNAPDLAFMRQGGGTWLNVAIGSGYRGHPLSTATQDRFYSLRDYWPFAPLTQDEYDSLDPITEADLVDVSTDINPNIPPGSKGWRFDLKQGNTWLGEKSLSEARTFQNVIQFATYEPSIAAAVSNTACSPSMGTNRLYSVSAFTGAPVINRDSPTDPPDSASDRLVQLAQGGIAPEVVWLFPSPDNPDTCSGADCRPSPICLIGLENCGTGVTLAPIRTFWRQTGSD